MKENLEASLEVALKVKQWAMVENHILSQTLRDNPGLSDELQILLGKISDNAIKKYEASCSIIALLAERVDLFGKEGLEKKCRYEEKDDENEVS